MNNTSTSSTRTDLKETLKKLSRDEATSLYWKCSGREHSEIATQVFDKSKFTIQNYISSAYEKLGLETASGKSPSREDLESYCDAIIEMVGALEWPNQIPRWPPVVPRNRLYLLVFLVVVALLLAAVYFRFQEALQRFLNPAPIVVEVTRFVPVTVEVVRTVLVTPPPVEEATPPSTSEVVRTEVPIAPVLDITTIPTEIPTPTEIPILTVGSEIVDSNVSWKLDEKQFNKDNHALVYWFEFKNKTFEEILLILSVEDFIMKDNLNREYPCTNLQRDFYDVYTHEEFIYSVKDSGEFRLVVRCGKGKAFGADVEDVILFVPEVYSLPPSEWVIEVGP